MSMPEIKQMALKANQRTRRQIYQKRYTWNRVSQVLDKIIFQSHGEHLLIH